MHNNHIQNQLKVTNDVLSTHCLLQQGASPHQARLKQPAAHLHKWVAAGMPTILGCGVDS